MTRMKTRLITGDTSQYPYNTHFTDHERQVLRMVADLRTRATSLKKALRKLPYHAHKPPENYDPDDMEEFSEIADALDALESQLRWIPGGAHRFAADE